MSHLADLEFDDLRDYVRDLLHQRGPAGTDIDRLRQELPYHPLLRQYQQTSDSLRDRLRRVSLALLEETEVWPVENLHYLLTFIEEGRLESGIEPLKSIVSSGAWLERPGGRQLQMLALRTLLGLGWLGDPNFWLRQSRLLEGEYPELIFRALVAHDLDLAFEHLGDFAASPAQASRILWLYPSLIEKHSLETVRTLTRRAAAKLAPGVMNQVDAWFRQREYGSIAPSGCDESKPETESESWERKDEEIARVQAIVSSRDKDIRQLERRIEEMEQEAERVNSEFGRLKEEARQKIDTLMERIRDLNQRLQTAPAPRAEEEQGLFR